MPKTKRNYKNFIGFNSSDKFVMAIEAARRSKSAIEKFGVLPSKTEFIRYTIVYFIKNEMKDVFNDFKNMGVPEINDFLKKQNGL
jgi:hypothetical protein